MMLYPINRPDGTQFFLRSC